jgi:hypothetical protein
MKPVRWSLQIGLVLVAFSFRSVAQTPTFECVTTSPPAVSWATTVHAVMIYSFDKGQDTQIQSYLLIEPASTLNDYIDLAP